MGPEFTENDEYAEPTGERNTPEASAGREGAGKAKRERIKFHEIGAANDMRYRGPMTYQHLRILAWIFLALSQIGVIIGLVSKLSPDIASRTGDVISGLSLFSDLATSCFLLANFAVILCAREGYKKLLVRFGAMTAGAALLFYFLYEHLAVGILAAWVGSGDKARAILGSIVAPNGSYMAFNIFLDLFLCTLVMCFLNYRPKKAFTGRKLIVFRAFVLLPILYEAASVALKILASNGQIVLPRYCYPFLTTKPPVSFLVFIVLAIFIKRRERKYKKQGGSAEGYKDFLNTRTNSWQFSVHAAIILTLAAVFDFLILIGIVTAMAYAQSPEAVYDTGILRGLALKAVNWGFGQSIPLLLAAPIMLLFSYNKAPRHPERNAIIPIAGVGLIVLIYIESIAWLLRLLPLVLKGVLEKYI